MPYAESNGTKIYFEVRGTSGPPLVMIRGFASPIWTWNGVDHDLASDHVTVVLDNRGVGRSSVPRGTYNAACMADDVATVLNHAELDSAHVLGTSLGGMIAQELALRHPRRVRSLVLVGTTPGNTGGFPLRPQGVLALAAASVAPAQIRSRLVAYATLSPAARIAKSKADDSSADTPPRTRTALAGLVGQAFAIFGHKAGERLASIRVPTLVVHGEFDNLIDQKYARQLAQIIPAAQLETWSEAGHDLATESPQRLADTVRRHVRQAMALNGSAVTG